VGFPAPCAERDSIRIDIRGGALLEHLLDLKQAVADATRAEVIAAVGALYDAQTNAVAERKPVCIASGRCCKFEEFGHRLYVTTAELAFFCDALARLSTISRAAWDGRGCPFQIGKLCGVHGIKPLGCRMFFCDATATEWQNQQYEHFHAALRALHEQHHLAYHYVEWRSALIALELAQASTKAPRKIT
jgi:Fe-S-cluster containining protein